MPSPCDKAVAIERGMRIIGGNMDAYRFFGIFKTDRCASMNLPVCWVDCKMVNCRLKEKSMGLLTMVMNDRPIAVQYEITHFGRSALSVLEKLKIWAEENRF